MFRQGKFPSLAFVLFGCVQIGSQGASFVMYVCVCVTLASRYCAIKLMRFHHSSETARNSSEFVSSSNLLLSISPAANKNKHLPHASRRISFCFLRQKLLQSLGIDFSISLKVILWPEREKSKN